MKENKTLSGFLVFSILIIVAIAASYFVTMSPQEPDELSYNEFLQQLEEKSISSIYIVETNVYGLYKNSEISEEDFPKKYDFLVNTTNVTDLEGDFKSCCTWLC